MLSPFEDLTHVAFICKNQKLTEPKVLEIGVSTKSYFLLLLSLYFVLATRMFMKLANCAIYRIAESRESRLKDLVRDLGWGTRITHAEMAFDWGKALLIPFTEPPACLTCPSFHVMGTDSLLGTFLQREAAERLLRRSFTAAHYSHCRFFFKKSLFFIMYSVFCFMCPSL